MTNTDLFLVGAVIGALGFYVLVKACSGSRRRRILKKAKKGEVQAIRLLEGQGYVIVAVQEKKTIVTWIDGRPYENRVKADFLVKRRGKLYVAEVKTGQTAPRPVLAETRRQLLEYYLAYQADGIILVDMEKKRIHEIAFTIAGHDNRRQYLLWAALAGLVGLICGYLLFEYTGGGI